MGLSILLALFALLVVGLPANLTRHITSQIQAAGCPLQVQSIRLSIHRGWVLNNARLYSTSPDDLQPLLIAKKIYIMPWPVDWKNPATSDWYVKIYARDLGISLGRPWESVLVETHPFRKIDKLNASLTVASGHITIEDADLTWGNVTILTRGSATFSVNEQKSPRQDTTEFRRSAAKAADVLSRLKCDELPQLNITFNYNDTLPAENFLNATLSAKGLILRDRVYKNLAGAFIYRDNIWSVPMLQLTRTSGEDLTLHGSFNTGTSNIQISAENTLSVSDLFNLLPDDTQSAVAQTGIKPYGRFDFTASAGPASYARLPEVLELHVQTAQLKRNDITLDPLTLHLVRNGNRIEINNIKAHLNDGSLAGRLEVDMESKNFSGQMQAQCTPGPVCALIDDDLHDFISRFNFSIEPPKVDLAISYDAAKNLVTVTGTLAGNRFTCGGVPLDHFDAFMVYSNQVLDLTPLHITRANEQFDGSVQVDFVQSLSFFNATNSFPPADIARVLAPEEHTILEEIKFDGPVYAAGRGQLDYNNWTNHNFKGTFRAENIGMGKVKASQFNTEVRGLGAQLLFTNATLQLYGGTAEGSAEFDILLEDGTAPYHINAGITKLSLEQLLQQTSSGDFNRLNGELSCTLNVSADAIAGFWKSVRGDGKVEINDGRLADVPLFGGFTRLAQSVFPSFNLFSLTAFTADYKLHDGAVWSDNAQLGGTLVSARGRGNYSPEKGLDFVVTAEPLRQTSSGDKERGQLQRLAASALREGTAPLFRLLDVRLTGPIDKPDWHFDKLP